ARPKRLGRRQLEREHGALAGDGANLDGPAVRLCDRAGDEESEARPGPAPPTLRAAERLEDHAVPLAAHPGPAATATDLAAAAARERSTSTDSPPFDHFTALSIRFPRTCRSRMRSPRTVGSGRRTTARTVTSSWPSDADATASSASSPMSTSSNR